MAEKQGMFDAEAFYEALDSTRQARDLTWRRVAAEAGVSASTLTRMAQGKRPDVDSLAALAAWSGLNADDFVRPDRRARKKPEPLAMISTLLRSDPNLDAAAAAALDDLIKAAYKRFNRRG